MKILLLKKSANYMNLFIRTFLLYLSLLIMTGCGGGFQEDNENANEFKNPIFNPGKVESDNTD